jgi:uncharacterized protein YbjT (DUF2867 family)
LACPDHRHSLRPLASVAALVGVVFAFFLLLAALRPSTRQRQRERPAAADVATAARPSAAAGLLTFSPISRAASLPQDSTARASPFRLASDEPIF